MISKGVEPPVQKKFKTGRKVVPTEHHDCDALLAEFIAVRERMAKAVVEPRGSTSRRRAFPSLSRCSRCGSARASRSRSLDSARRHLWQVRQVKASTGS